jgi:HTH-type transcriptional regulator/antitoxin HigA
MTAAKKIIDSLKLDLKAYTNKVDPTYLKLVEIFPLQPISSKVQHNLALKVVEKLISLLNKEVKSESGVEIYLQTLSDLVRDYEQDEYRSMKVSGSDMLAYLMELQGLTQTDLAKELGGQPIVSKILKGERELNIRQIKALSKRFKVAPEVFI